MTKTATHDDIARLLDDARDIARAYGYSLTAHMIGVATEALREEQAARRLETQRAH